MLTAMLQRGGGNLLAFLLPVVVLVAALKGAQLLMRSLKRKRHRRAMLSGMYYDGIMDEFVAQDKR